MSDKASAVIIPILGGMASVNLNIKNNLPVVKKQLLNLKEKIDRIALIELDKYAQKIQNIMVNRFDRTAVYKRPSRKTGALRYAINQHKIVRLAGMTGYAAYIGDAGALPFYWKTQEYGKKPYTFTEQYVPVWINGEVELYTVKPAQTGTLNNFIGNPGSIGANRKFFTYNPKENFVTLNINHPGVKARGFVAFGVRSLHMTGATFMKNLISKALKAK